MLLSNDGPYRNVLKFKSPLVFSTDDAKELVEKLDSIMLEMEFAEVCLFTYCSLVYIYVLFVSKSRNKIRA